MFPAQMMGWKSIKLQIGFEQISCQSSQRSLSSIYKTPEVRKGERMRDRVAYDQN